MKLKKRYGRLEVTGRPERVGNNYRVSVRCDCGTETYVWVHNLKAGATRSCGCLRADLAAERMKERDAERAQKITERVNEEKRLKQLKRDANRISSRPSLVSKIVASVPGEIDEIGEEIKKKTDQESERQWRPMKDLLDSGFMPGYVYNSKVHPIFEECERIRREVNEETERLKDLLEKGYSRAARRGKKAMLKAGIASEALFTRVAARSFRAALRKLIAKPGGEIRKQLLFPVESVEIALHSWLKKNGRERARHQVPKPLGITFDAALAPSGISAPAE
ncbi:MAG: hypothetical protein JW818_06385 [Pirellulales bacterium]|nr:hypothetical protein [Pirellulales bacterium]